MKRVIWLLILILVSCSKSKEDLPEQTPLEIVKAEKPEVKFQQMEFKKEDMPLSIKNFKGLIEKGLRWNDINGDNIFIFTEEPSINIDELDGEEAFGQAQFWHGYHYCNYNSGEYKLVREFKDGIGFCSEDLVFEVLTDGFFVADNNSNKIGEVIIIYKIACVGGVDPIDLKFLVFENGKKYSYVS